MSTESNKASAETDDDIIDARIRAQLGCSPAARGLAPKVIQRIHRRNRLRRQSRIAATAGLVLVIGSFVWRSWPGQPAEERPRAPSVAVANVPRLTPINETTAALLAAPPPVTKLDVIDEHQSALLTGLQTMLEEEQK